jgi:hypothetical protein
MAGSPTHAIFVRVSFKPGLVEAAIETLHNQVIPGAKAAPGFIAGYWLHSADRTKGTSVELFDSLENAEAELGRRSLVTPSEAPLTIDSAEILEVAARA